MTWKNKSQSWDDLSFHPDHRADLQKSGLTPEIVKAAGIHSLCPADIPKNLRGLKSAYKIPYPGKYEFARLKLFPPLKDMKYYQPANSGIHLYIPPEFNQESETIYITEGEKKTLKAQQEGLDCIGIGGIWNFAPRKNDKPQLIDDFNFIEWNNKKVVLVPDSDFATNIKIRHAVYRLGRLLEEKGAEVLVIDLSSAVKEDGAKVGLDDYLLTHSVTEFLNPDVVKRVDLKDSSFDLVRKWEENNTPTSLPPGFIKTAEKEEEKQKPPVQLVFPDSLLTGAAGNFANTYSKYLETPKPFLFVNYLTCLGTYVGGMISIESERQPQPRLFTIILGESADTRKSSSIEVTIELFREVWEEMHVCYGVGSAEGLSNELRKSPRLLLHLDELKTLIEKMKIEGSILLPCITSLFESNRFHNSTKKHTIKINDAYLTILGCCTREIYENLFTSKFVDIGLINRLFLVLDKGKRRFSLPKIISPEVKNGLRKQLKEVLLMIDELGKNKKYLIPITPEALKMFDEWYFNLPQTPYTKRLDTYGHRIMPLLALNEKKDKIDEDVMKKTIALLDYEHKVRELTDPIDAYNLIARLEASLRKVLSQHGALTRRTLGRKCHQERYGKYIWNWGITNLKNSGEIKEKNKKFFLTMDSEENEDSPDGDERGLRWDGLHNKSSN